MQVNSDDASEFICTKTYIRYGVFKISNTAWTALRMRVGVDGISTYASSLMLIPEEGS